MHESDTGPALRNAEGTRPGQGTTVPGQVRLVGVAGRGRELRQRHLRRTGSGEYEEAVQSQQPGQPGGG